MPKTNDDKGGTKRRDFLKLASLGTVLGGAALATGTRAEAMEAEDGSATGYRETTHVKTYYDLTRF